jgi:hypothetical protein
VNVWYLTFHGGTGNHDLNNIHVFSETGEELRKALDRKGLPGNIAVCGHAECLGPARIP